MNKRYEVQHYTLCDGWTNTWLNWDENGNVERDTFDSYADASMALDEFLTDTQEDFEAGDLESPYEQDEFRIVEVTE